MGDSYRIWRIIVHRPRRTTPDLLIFLITSAQSAEEIGISCARSTNRRRASEAGMRHPRAARRAVEPGNAKARPPLPAARERPPAGRFGPGRHSTAVGARVSRGIEGLRRFSCRGGGSGIGRVSTDQSISRYPVEEKRRVGGQVGMWQGAIRVFSGSTFPAEAPAEPSVTDTRRAIL